MYEVKKIRVREGETKKEKEYLKNIRKEGKREEW